MATIDDKLFADFADVLNVELETLGASLRIDRQPPPSGDGMTLLDARQNIVGWLPDHADAEIIAAIERLRTNQ